MNSKSDKNVIKKIQIASENAVKVTSKKVTDDLVVIEINDKLMTEEHIQMFSSAVDEQLADKCKSFVVDLSKLKRINSSGLGSLISVYTSIRNKDGEMKIGGLNEFISKVLEITKLIEVFEYYETSEEAVDSFLGK